MSQLNVTSLKHESASGDNITLSSNGNVGINTSSPSAKLDVRGSSTFLVNATNPTAWVSVDSALTTGSMYNQWNTTSNVGISGTYTNHPYMFVTNNTERMRIDSAGRVTMPYQPMACASWTATQSVNNIIGSAAPYTITNVGNHLSGAIFTCPVNGVYRATLTAMTGNGNSLNARLRFNGADYWGSDTFAAYSPNITYSRVVISALVVCSASDTLNFYLDNGSGNIHPGYGQISFELVG